MASQTAMTWASCSSRAGQRDEAEASEGELKLRLQPALQATAFTTSAHVPIAHDCVKVV